VAFMTPEADDNRLAEEHRPNEGLDKSSPYFIKWVKIVKNEEVNS